MSGNNNANATAKAVLVDAHDSVPKFVWIDVTFRYVNGGLDIKFEEGNEMQSSSDLSHEVPLTHFHLDPFNVSLHGIMTASDYEASIHDLNGRLLECRASSVDFALISMGPLLFPLVYFALRSKKQKKLRNSIIRQFVVDFNRQYPHLIMKWAKRPTKILMIIKKQDYDAIENS